MTEVTYFFSGPSGFPLGNGGYSPFLLPVARSSVRGPVLSSMAGHQFLSLWILLWCENVQGTAQISGLARSADVADVVLQMFFAMDVVRALNFTHL